MISRKQQAICDEARTWLGTPFQHQAMVKGSGVDCAMFVAGVALNVGLVSPDELINIPNYPREWHLHQDFPMLNTIMESFGCKKVDIDSIEAIDAGDILVFKFGRVPSHLGLMLENGEMIHAYSGSVNKVVINSVSAQWIDRFVGVYRLPGV